MLPLASVIAIVLPRDDRLYYKYNTSWWNLQVLDKKLNIL